VWLARAASPRFRFPALKLLPIVASIAVATTTAITVAATVATAAGTVTLNEHAKKRGPFVLKDTKLFFSSFRSLSLSRHPRLIALGFGFGYAARGTSLS